MRKEAKGFPLFLFVSFSGGNKKDTTICDVFIFITYEGKFLLY